MAIFKSFLVCPLYDMKSYADCFKVKHETELHSTLVLYMLPAIGLHSPIRGMTGTWCVNVLYYIHFYI